ncbi:hypothetical protein DYD83_07385 [Dickeya fangzhongdai]|uniref:Uncharacterized protein n=1 Tax=Dickeya fangzhongdai TaxID=1778540 RepID=A0A2K8QJX4_9GAMM|nr:hypothetical protein CVE23_07340 [Dickeya fangzhongdai]QOH47243.1 hypothetical protein DYD82_07385 [Dickeya fangzhongdai]QOH51549.1 hypothetical protein DYD83_07385 [Dickeya fangzhongdai]
MSFINAFIIYPLRVIGLYPSYFKLQVCWLRSFTRITYLSKLIGIHSLAAFLQLELFWVYIHIFFHSDRLYYSCRFIYPDIVRFYIYSNDINGILYLSYFKLQVRWLPSLTPVTYLCKLLGIHSVAAFPQLELFWV